MSIDSFDRGMNGRPAIYDHSQFMGLYRAGCSDLEIARQTGADRTTVLNWRRNEGLDSHFLGAFGLDPAENRIRLDLHAAGMTDKQMASALGINVSSVGKWRARNRLPPNRRSSS